MTKEYVYASRDIKAGEELVNVTNREKGYFYFVDAEGTMLRAKQDRRKPLSAEEVARRAAEKQAAKDWRLKLRAAREADKRRQREAREATRALRRAEKEAKVLARIERLRKKVSV